MSLSLQIIQTVATTMYTKVAILQHGTEDSLVVAADAAAEISAETAALIAGKQYCSILYVKYRMHAPQNHEVSREYACTTE